MIGRSPNCALPEWYVETVALGEDDVRILSHAWKMIIETNEEIEDIGNESCFTKFCEWYLEHYLRK